MDAMLKSLAEASGAAEMRQCGDDLVRQAQMAMMGRLQEHEKQVHELRMELKRRPSGSQSELGTLQIVEEIDADRRQALQRVSELEEEVSDLRLLLSLGKSLSQEEQLKETLLERLDEVKRQEEIMQKEFERLRKENFELSDRLLTAQRECSEAVEERNLAVQRSEKLEHVITALRKRLEPTVGRTISTAGSLTSLSEQDGPSPPNLPNSPVYALPNKMACNEMAERPSESASCTSRSSRPASTRTLSGDRLQLVNQSLSNSSLSQAGITSPMYARTLRQDERMSVPSSKRESLESSSMDSFSPEHIYATPDLSSTTISTQLLGVDGNLSAEKPYGTRPLASLMSSITPTQPKPQLPDSHTPSSPASNIMAAGTLSRANGREGPPVLPYASSRGSSQRNQATSKGGHAKSAFPPKQETEYSAVSFRQPGGLAAQQASASPTVYSIPNKPSANHQIMTSSLINTTPDRRVPRSSRHGSSCSSTKSSRNMVNGTDPMSLSLPGSDHSHPAPNKPNKVIV